MPVFNTRTISSHETIQMRVEESTRSSDHKEALKLDEIFEVDKAHFLIQHQCKPPVKSRNTTKIAPHID